MKKTLLLIILTMVLVFCFCQKKSPTAPPPENHIHPQVDIPWPSLADSPWPMHHHDPQSTGRSPYKGPQRGKIKWRFDVGAKVGNSAVIGADETIYFGSGFEYLNNKPTSFLYALNFNGSLKWKVETHNGFVSDPVLACSPIVARDGTIYVGSSDFQFYAINPDGSLKWTFKADNRIRISGMNIGLDGVIYFIDWNHYLYAVNPDGTLRWKVDGYHKFQDAESAGISFSPDGTTLYVGFVGTAESDTMTGLAAIDLSGNVNWVFKTGAAYGTPLVDNNGNIFFGAGLGKGSQDEKQTGVFSVTPEGELRWKYLSDYMSVQDLTMDYNGNIYFGVSKGGTESWLISLDNEGNFRWQLNLSQFGHFSSSPICDVDGTIYIAAWDKEVMLAISCDGNLIWQVEIGPVGFVSPAMTSDLLFVGTWYYRNKGKEFVCIQ